jgi:hypothetical protein
MVTITEEILCDICKYSGACGCRIVECNRYVDPSTCPEGLTCNVFQPCSGVDENTELDGHYDDIEDYYNERQEVPL